MCFICRIEFKIFLHISLFKTYRTNKILREVPYMPNKSDLNYPNVVRIIDKNVKIGVF